MCRVLVGADAAILGNVGVGSAEADVLFVTSRGCAGHRPAVFGIGDESFRVVKFVVLLSE
ncbi:hypothetical protein GN958_ATG14350 [Phytophthora infestans]|uniref:Uncharacterized protein n=1 Tax=Phytophthora infestans TaxID=4787 RepID=A0A8S9U5X6_PHYIN|nr:hypothetical protein GN958_ATG14350 [Phytophthora infestans]